MGGIVQDQNIRSGDPCIAGTRIAVFDLKSRVIGEGEDPHVVAGEYAVSMEELSPRWRIITSIVAIVGALAATAFAGIVITVTLLHFERLHDLATLVGAESLLAGWAVLAALSTIYTAILVISIETVVPRRHARLQHTGLDADTLVCAAAWAVVVTVGVLLWLDSSRGANVPIPHVAWDTFLPLLLYGGIVAILYPFVRRCFVPPGPASIEG